VPALSAPVEVRLVRAAAVTGVFAAVFAAGAVLFAGAPWLVSLADSLVTDGCFAAVGVFEVLGLAASAEAAALVDFGFDFEVPAGLAVRLATVSLTARATRLAAFFAVSTISPSAGRFAALRMVVPFSGSVISAALDARFPAGLSIGAASEEGPVSCFFLVAITRKNDLSSPVVWTRASALQFYSNGNETHSPICNQCVII
jgi:hypothetical protein